MTDLIVPAATVLVAFLATAVVVVAGCRWQANHATGRVTAEQAEARLSRARTHRKIGG